MEGTLCGGVAAGRSSSTAPVPAVSVPPVNQSSSTVDVGAAVVSGRAAGAGEPTLCGGVESGLRCAAPPLNQSSPAGWGSGVVSVRGCGGMGACVVEATLCGGAAPPFCCTGEGRLCGGVPSASSVHESSTSCASSAHGSKLSSTGCGAGEGLRGGAVEATGCGAGEGRLCGGVGVATLASAPATGDSAATPLCCGVEGSPRRAGAAVPPPIIDCATACAAIRAAACTCSLWMPVCGSAAG